MMNGRLALCILLLLPLLGCVGKSANQSPKPFFELAPPSEQTVSTAPEKKEKVEEKEPQHSTITPMELQAGIMSFADTSSSRIGDASKSIKKIGTPEARLTAARMLVFDISSNVEIAAGPYPGVALLDLIVVTTLRRMVWEDHWVPKFGPEAEEALIHYQSMEKDIWEAAKQIMTDEQLEEVADTILEWRTAHPDQVGVNYVRFSDFGDLGLKPSMHSISEPGGLFASVKEVTMIAQDMKVAIDRAFYLVSRMQLIASFQAELAYLELLYQPEVDGLINQSDEITTLAERYAEIMESMPQEINQISKGLITELFSEMSRNTDRAIAVAVDELAKLEKQVLEDAINSVSREREAAINHAFESMAERQEELYNHIDMLVDRSGTEIENSITHAFMLSIAFMVAFFVLLTLYKVFVARPIDRRRG